MRRPKGTLAIAIAVFATMTSSNVSVQAGIVSASSSNTSVATISATPDFAGSVYFDPAGYFSAALMTETLLSAGSTTLTFNYSGGFDAFGDVLRPILYVVNNTGGTVEGLSFTFTNATAFGFYTTGSATFSSIGATVEETNVGPVSAGTMTIPISLESGDALSIYLPVYADSARRSFSLTQSTSPAVAAVPEPATIAAAGMAVVIGLGYARRRRKPSLLA